MPHPLADVALHRRAFLGIAAAGVAAAPAIAAGQPFFRRRGLPIGLQLYTLGNISQTLDQSLAGVAATGFETVELAGYYGRTPVELRQSLDRAGLRCTSSHVRLRPGQDYAKLAAEARVIGFERVIHPMFNFPPGAELRPGPGETTMDAIGRLGQSMTRDQWKAQAEFLNAAGAALKAEGLRVGYHNHNVEFAPKRGGETGLDTLLKETDPTLVSFEMDAGWVAAAGLDPVELLRRHPGRFELMHVKDIKASTKPNFALRQDPAEVGSGSMNWPRILSAAYAAGVRCFFVEQEPPFTRDRLESVAISFKYLQGVAA